MVVPACLIRRRFTMLLILLVVSLASMAQAFPQNQGAASAGGSEETSPLQTVKVAAIQCSSVLGDVEGNRRKITALVEEAAAQGAKIVVLPEAAITGYLSQDLRTDWHLSGWPIEPGVEGKDPTPFAEPVPGPSTRHFSEVARRCKVYLTVPFLEVEYPSNALAKVSGQSAVSQQASREPRFYNTVCLISPEGQIVAHYRKLTPWPPPEKPWATPGDRGIQVYDTEYGRVGLAICYDIHTILPKYEPLRIWALLYPIAWVDKTHPAEWFWHKLPARTSKFKHYVIGANWSVDHPENWYGYGFSIILSPEGKVLASAKSLYGSEIVYATIKTAWAK